MKIITILGSPKKNGKTAETLSLLGENLIAQGHEMEQIPIVDHAIKGCVGCLACKINNDHPGCSQKDDARAIFDKMIAADVIVYASPIYCCDITSQLKALIDRHFSLLIRFGTPDASSFVAKKRVALLLTCAGGEENADLAGEIFDRFGKVLQCDIVGKYTVANSSAPDFTLRAGQTAAKMAKDLICL